jgi:hypothetical protein
VCALNIAQIGRFVNTPFTAGLQSKCEWFSGSSMP